jgi:hypothetical protein
MVLHTNQGFNLKDEPAVTKTRWLQKFDTSKYVRSEVPLDANEKPTKAYLLPVQGCDLMLAPGDYIPG